MREGRLEAALAVAGRGFSPPSGSSSEVTQTASSAKFPFRPPRSPRPNAFFLVA